MVINDENTKDISATLYFKSPPHDYHAANKRRDVHCLIHFSLHRIILNNNNSSTHLTF